MSTTFSNKKNIEVIKIGASFIDTTKQNNWQKVMEKNNVKTSAFKVLADKSAISNLSVIQKQNIARLYSMEPNVLMERTNVDTHTTLWRRSIAHVFSKTCATEFIRLEQNIRTTSIM